MTYLTVSDVARGLNVRPRDISDLFYNRELSDKDCPIVGGKRLISTSYVPVIAASLRKHGILADSSFSEDSSADSKN